MPATRVADLLQVGDVLAERILAHLGGTHRSDRLALDIITADPDKLLEIQGIGPSKRDAIIRANGFDHVRRRHRPERERRPRHASDALAGLGLSDAQRATALERFGRREESDEPSARLVRVRIDADPYLLMEIPGVSYRRVFDIAVSIVRVDPNDAKHNAYANRDILERLGGVAPPNLVQRERRRRQLASDPRLAREGLIDRYRLLWLPEEWNAEGVIAQWLSGGSNVEPLNYTEADEAVLIEKHRLNTEQRSFVRGALASPLAFLTGAAGTGKTITITALIDLIRHRGINTHVLTLAGKSAERVAQACRNRNIRITLANEFGVMIDDDRHAPRGAGMVYITTIHRGLRADGNGSFGVRELAADCIIIDEASMVPNNLLAEILCRTRPNTRIILAGDPSQLPPIQYGRPFEDALTLIPSNAHWSHLTTNYRQAEQESIHIFANALRERTKPPFLRAPGLDVHTECPPERAVDHVIEHLGERARDALSWQVITSTNRVRVALNTRLQNHVNHDGEPLARVRELDTTTELRRADKIVIIKNDYSSGVMNGQTGIILDRGKSDGDLTLRVEDVLVELTRDQVYDHVRLGYAITVHKAQGSGWPYVYSIEDGPIWNHPNRLIYTAVTRAERYVMLATSSPRPEWWDNATQPEPARTSTLTYRLTTTEDDRTHTPAQETR